jgi:hypothetical protein
MPSPLRFTGENPPPELWQEFPNWRDAYEEEGEEGQNETTLMPHEEQSHIAEHTSFTAGRVRFSDGREFPAFMAVAKNQVDGCQVYESAAPWRIYYKYPEKRWVPYRAEWLSEPERSPSVSFEDAKVFPLEIRLRLPWKRGEAPKRYRIDQTGQMREK